MRRRTYAVVIVATWMLLGSVVQGAEVSSLPPATKQMIRDEVLDAAKVDTVIATVQELTAAVLKQPDWKQKLMTRMKMPFDAQVEDLQADATAAPILKAHSLSARQYMLQLLALRAASQAAAGASEGLAALANPANVALLKANPILQKKLAEAEMGGPKGQH